MYFIFQSTEHVVCNPTRVLASNQYVNLCCFAPPIPGANGDFVFPSLRGPSLSTSDLALFKSFAFTERKRLEFRALAYNFLITRSGHSPGAKT
jgi:hypothetical protein